MKRKTKQSNKVKNCNDCKKVSNKSKSKDIGFEKETKSFELDENDDHSFELK